MQRSALSPVRRTRRLTPASTPRSGRTPRTHAATPDRTAIRPAPELQSPLSPLKQKTRKTLGAIGAIWLAFAASATSLAAPVDSAPPLSAAQKKDPVIVRGQYLVEPTGLCADCHTPRNEKGQFAQWSPT